MEIKSALANNSVLIRDFHILFKDHNVQPQLSKRRSGDSSGSNQNPETFCTSFVIGSDLSLSWVKRIGFDERREVHKVRKVVP